MSDTFIKDTDNRMIIRQPAVSWHDALPCGNGSLAALVFGHIRDEQILINHEALWFTTPRPDIPDTARHLPELQKLLAQGQFATAGEFFQKKWDEAGYKGTNVDPYHPAFQIEHFTETQGAFRNYKRTLDMRRAVTSVVWENEWGAFQRDCFVSRHDDMIVLSLRGDRPGVLSGAVRLSPFNLHALATMGAGQDIVAPKVPLTFAVSQDEQWLTICGRYEDGREFGGVAHVQIPGGAVSFEYDRLNFKHADYLTLRLKLFIHEPAAAAIKRLKEELINLPCDYLTLEERHVPGHAALFDRQQLDLGVSSEESALSNDQLLLDAYCGNIQTALIQRMSDYGRYLLICSSRPGGWPANLQGKWNGDYSPAWSSDYHNDINIQMNYAQALPGNLPEVILPYFDYYESFLEEYRNNAQKVFGCRGILAPIAQSTHGAMLGGAWLSWTGAAAWLAQLYFDYWLFTGDREFLEKRAIPFMREIAEFYEDFLVERPGGMLMFSPSLSPENRPDIANSHFASVDATMDVALAKELLSNLCQACEVAGIDHSQVSVWKAMLAKLPAYQVNADGALKE